MAFKVFLIGGTDPSVFRKCTGKDEVNFQLLATELDAGEAEGLVQAQERGAEFFLVDERKAREVGVRQGLILYGTMRLLARFCIEGYAEDIWGPVRKLRRERHFRIGDEVVRRAIASGETPIGRFSDRQENP